MPASVVSTITEDLFKLPNAPVVCSDRAGWNRVQLALFDQPPHRIVEHTSPHHVICINAGVPVLLEQTIDGQTDVGESIAGDIGIYPAHLHQSFEWFQSARFLQLYLEPQVLNEIGSELYGKDDIELLPQGLPSDPVIYQIAIALKNILHSPTDVSKVGSQLYVDSLTTALATHLVYQYASDRPTATNHAGRLSATQLKQVQQHIDEHLAEDISLADLANVIQLSAFHFSRLFKQSTGLAPHQYHIRCRIDEARRLVKQQMPLTQIAHALGFSSQSHLNYHFKRVVGMTPTAYRRL